jgi:hypothetical protein
MERDPDKDAARAEESHEALAARLSRLRDTAPPDPPPALEARLRASLAARRARRSRLRLAGAGAGLLAAAALMVWLRPLRDEQGRQGQQPVATTPAAPAPKAGTATTATSPRPGRFRPLGFDHQPETIFTHTARVELGAETAAYFGWPVAADVPRARVQAEVLYGEDGVARGLRFLPTSFRSLPLPQETGVNP